MVGKNVTAKISQKCETAQRQHAMQKLMEVFQNGLTGLLVVCRVGVDSNYVIETVPVPFQPMEEKVVRAGILQMCEHV